MKPYSISPGGGEVVFVFDLDGTLLNDEEKLSNRNKEAVIEASKNNIVVFASGRMLKSILKFSRENFGREFITIAYNGAMVYIPEEGIVFERKIDPETSRKVIIELRNRKVHRQAYVNDNLISEEDNEEVRAYAKHSGVNYTVVNDLVKVVSKYGSTKILSISDPEILNRIRDELRRVFKNLKIFKSFPNYLDFVPKDVSKAFALKVLSEKLGFDLEETIAFGDNDNDVDMIKEVGFGVAVKNATKAVLEASDYITLSNNEDGVAEVVFGILSGSIKPFLKLDRS